MICLQEDYARCRADMALDGSEMKAGVEARTPMPVTGVSRYGGLRQGGREQGRDVDRLEGRTGALFTGLGDTVGGKG